MESESTSWTVIRQAAAGSREHRETFAVRYAPVARAYLAARWRTSIHAAQIDDAVQDVFVECFRPGGVLERVEMQRPGGFRAFLFGVIRNIALRVETRGNTPPTAMDLEHLPADEESLSAVFDRAWARAMVREAADHQAALATTRDEAARRRVELLRLRFFEGLPLQEIASRWQVDIEALYREHRRARDEFRAALHDVVALHHRGSTPGEVQRQCQAIFDLLK